MGLDKAGLKTAIKTAFLNRFPSYDSSQESEMDGLANDLANAIDDYVKTADVEYVAATLTAPSGGGSVTGTPGTAIATLT